MPTAVENYIFNELPRRVVIDPSIATGSSFTAAWLLAATGVGTQAIPVDPATLGFEPEVTPPGVDPEIKFWNGNKDWVEISAAAIGAIPTSEKGQPLGVATLDADGYVELSQMNPAVIERVVVVADEAARYALTTAQVQNGDVVNQQSPLPGTMWYVVDDTNLDNSAGYLPFSAGVAASVAWSGITGKPAIIGDLENIALADEGDVIQYVAGEWVNVDPATLKTSLSISISDVASLQDELDLKQSQSTVLDNLSAISTPGIVVRTVDGDFIGRELVGINGLEVTEADGNADNPTISLTETGVTAGTYGNEYEHPVVEVDSYGRIVTVTTASASNKEVVYILDVPTTQLVGNTVHIFGGAVPTYASNILLELPENVPGGTWVKILCTQNFVEAAGTVGISATSPATIQEIPLLDYTAFFKLYPFTVIDLVYSEVTDNWTLTTNAVATHTYLYVANPSATDGVANSHSLISQATGSRSILIPDDDVDLSKVTQPANSVDDGYLSSSDWNTFNGKQDALPSAEPDPTTKYFRGDGSWQTLDADAVDLGSVDNTSDVDKPVSTAQATAIGLKADKTTTVSAGTGLSGGGDLSANRTIDLANTTVTPATYGGSGKTVSFTVDQQGRLTAASDATLTFIDATFRIQDNDDATKKIAFEASNIGTGQTKTISMPNFDVYLTPIRRRIQTSGVGLENLLLDNTETYIEITGGTTITVPVYPPYASNAGASGYLFNATNVAKTIRFRYIWSGEISSFVGTCNHFFPETNETGSYTSTAPGSSGNTYTDIQLLPGETLRFVVSGTKTLFTVNIYRNSSNVMYENTFKIKRSALESHGVRFETSAVTADRVITMPNADIDLGNVASAATTSANGYLTSADWNTFNNKQAALADVITGGTYGSSTQYPKVTVNAKGIVTGITLQTVPTPTFTDATFAVQKNGSPSISATWSLTAFTVSHVHTYPDKDIDFGNLSSVATTNGNNLSGTRTRILAGRGNTVSGTDVVLLAATGVSTTKINWSPVVIESSDSATGANPTACLSTITCTKATDSSLANSGSLNLTTDGAAAGTANTPRAWIAGVGNGVAVASTSVHEIEFDLLHGINAFGFVPYGAVFGVRKVAVYTDGTGASTASSVQTLGTDIIVGTTSGTLTMSVTIDTTNNRVVPTVTLSGASNAPIYLYAQAKIKSRYSRRI